MVSKHPSRFQEVKLEPKPVLHIRAFASFVCWNIVCDGMLSKPMDTLPASVFCCASRTHTRQVRSGCPRPHASLASDGDKPHPSARAVRPPPILHSFGCCVGSSLFSLTQTGTASMSGICTDHDVTSEMYLLMEWLVSSATVRDTRQAILTNASLSITNKTSTFRFEARVCVCSCQTNYLRLGFIQIYKNIVLLTLNMLTNFFITAVES